MSQHDLTIANQGFPAFRSDLNDALQALGSMQSGTSAPATTFANMLWYDTTNNIVKMRNEDNDAWISLFTLDQSGDLLSAVTATTLTSTNGATIQGLTVGRGAGSVATNTAVGASALGGGSQTGTNNTAVGNGTLAANTSGSYNTALGDQALNANTTGTDNTALGRSAMPNSTTGSYNVAVGRLALLNNTTASYNTAVGYQAGYSNTLSSYNVFLGFKAGYTHNLGSAGNGLNTFVGQSAGYSVTTGTNNTFIGGSDSGYYVTTGSKNTIIGGYNGNNGGLDIRTANNYIVLSDGDGNPKLFYDPSLVTWRCNDFYNTTTANAANLNIGTDGGVRRSTSALKYKQDVRDLEEMDINLLRAVRYKSKCEGDDQTKDHLGLIADEAAEAGFEELVTRGADGEVEGFQYERLTVVLLKSLQSLKAEFDAYKEAHP